MKEHGQIKQISAFSLIVIRYDTIEEFKVDSEAE